MGKSRISSTMIRCRQLSGEALLVLWSIARASPTYTNNGSQRSARSISGCGSSGSDHSSDAALGAVSKENSEDPRPRSSRVFKPRSQPTRKPHVTACKICQMEVGVVERVMGVGHSKVEVVQSRPRPKKRISISFPTRFGTCIWPQAVGSVRTSFSWSSLNRETRH